MALTVFVSAAYHLSLYKQWDTVTVTVTDTSPCIGLYEEIMIKLQFRVRAFYDISGPILRLFSKEADSGGGGREGGGSPECTLQKICDTEDNILHHDD